MFKNRLLAKFRPEYRAYLDWLDVGLETQDPMLLLARSGDARGTDLLEVFPQPEANAEGDYELCFFSHGLRHQSAETLARIARLNVGESLGLALVDDNPVDSFAIVLHTDDQVKAGFCPRYLAPDLRGLLESDAPWRLIVARVNPDAPIQFRLLCKLVFKLPQGAGFFVGEEFQPVSEAGGGKATD